MNMNLFSAELFARMTPEEQHRVSLLGVQARELKRMALEPPEYPPIPEGLQLVNLVLDFRTGNARAIHVFLFQHRGYKNRFSWWFNNRPQDGLIGWHDAMRFTANKVRPIIGNY